MLTASLIALAAAVFVGTPEEIEKKIEETRARATQAARLQQEDNTARAANPEAPGVLAREGDMPLATLRRRMAQLATLAAARQFTTSADPAVLQAMAASVGCVADGKAQPAGFVRDQARPKVLSGAILLATCPGEAYLFIEVTPIATGKGSGSVVFPDLYTRRVAGRPALKYYFKAGNGRQKDTLFVLDGNDQYTLDYWSQGDNEQKAMTGARRLDTLAMP